MSEGGSRRWAAVRRTYASIYTDVPPSVCSIRRWVQADSPFVTLAAGRPCTYTPAFIRKIVTFVVGNNKRDVTGARLQRHSLKETVKIYGDRGRKVDRKTLRKWVHDAGYRYRIRPRGLRLTTAHREQREYLVSEWIDSPALDWENICFSDSTLVYLNHVDAPCNEGVYVRDDEDVPQTTHFRHSQYLHVYGVITIFGLVGPFFAGRITAATYLPILKKMLLGIDALFVANISDFSLFNRTVPLRTRLPKSRDGSLILCTISGQRENGQLVPRIYRRLKMYGRCYSNMFLLAVTNQSPSKWLNVVVERFSRSSAPVNVVLSFTVCLNAYRSASGIISGRFANKVCIFRYLLYICNVMFF